MKPQAPEDRKLTLDDTQGIFLLLVAGFSIAIVAFTMECLCFAYKKRNARLIRDINKAINEGEQGSSISDSYQDQVQVYDDNLIITSSLKVLNSQYNSLNKKTHSI